MATQVCSAGVSKRKKRKFHKNKKKKTSSSCRSLFKSGLRPPTVLRAGRDGGVRRIGGVIGVVFFQVLASSGRSWAKSFHESSISFAVTAGAGAGAAAATALVFCFSFFFEEKELCAGLLSLFPLPQQQRKKKQKAKLRWLVCIIPLQNLKIFLVLLQG